MSRRTKKSIQYPMFPELSDPKQLEFDFIYPDDHTDPTPTSPKQKISGLIDATDIIIEAIKRDFGTTYNISAEQFELVIKELLERQGYSVLRPEGGATRKDGGIDLYACPKDCTFPFYLGIQVGQKQFGNKIAVQDVGYFDHAINRSSFVNAGVFVTNTTFTMDAHRLTSILSEKEGKLYLRLRGNLDLLRWVHGKYVTHQDLRELPRAIEVADGVKLQIPNPLDSIQLNSKWIA